MQQLADWIDIVLTGGDDDAVITRTGEQVSQICKEFPIPAVR